MTTNAELAGKLLRDAARFFRALAEENGELKPRLEENARTFELVAERVEADPQGHVPPATPASKATH